MKRSLMNERIHTISNGTWIRIRFWTLDAIANAFRNSFCKITLHVHRSSFNWTVTRTFCSLCRTREEDKRKIERWSDEPITAYIWIPFAIVTSQEIVRDQSTLHGFASLCTHCQAIERSTLSAFGITSLQVPITENEEIKFKVDARKLLFDTLLCKKKNKSEPKWSRRFHFSWKRESFCVYTQQPLAAAQQL